MTAYRQSRFQEVAHLRSVWWLVVAGCFFGVPRGSYKIQWEILEKRPSATYWCPRDGQELFNYTTKRYDPVDESNTVPRIHHNGNDDDETEDDFWDYHGNATWHAETPIRRTLELPGTVTIDQDYQNVMVEISNINSTHKSGLSVDFVRLVSVNDPEVLFP
ncbi:hypothetical protein BG000_010295 [Podila horticola]|nr:hypothetical protein BG000_010295 [Podila horticola]